MVSQSTPAETTARAPASRPPIPEDQQDRSPADNEYCRAVLPERISVASGRMRTQLTQDELAPIETPTAKERRRRIRYSCKGFAEGALLHRKLLFRGEIQNFSWTGCFVVTKAQLHLKRFDKVDIRFAIDRIPYQVIARVMRALPGEGLGLEFLFADVRSEELFRTLDAKLCALAPPK